MVNMSFPEKVDAWIFEKSGCHLQDFCRKFKYGSVETKVMGLDEHDEKKTKSIVARDAELRKLYVDCAASKSFVTRKGNNRSFTEYFKTLVAGWVLEDLTVNALKKQGIEIEYNGFDRMRKIESSDVVRQEPDFTIKVGDVVRKIELSCSFCAILENCKFIEKRCPSLVGLWKEKAIWLFRDINRGKYVIIDFATENVTLHLRKHNTSHQDWSKDVHRYYLEENGKKERDDRLLAAELISIAGCGIEEKEQPSLNEIEDDDSPPATFTIGGARRSLISKTKEVQHKKESDEHEEQKDNIAQPICDVKEKESVVKDTQDDSAGLEVDSDRSDDESTDSLDDDGFV